MESVLKNKKIAAYIALKHHTRFIVPVMKKLEDLGAKTSYIVGQAERSQEITAIETGLDYVHVYEYVQPSEQDEITSLYHILRDGFAKGMKKDIAIGACAMPTVLDKNLYNTAKEYIGFRNYIRTEKPDILFALHEVNRWGKMLGFWAKKENIPFFTLHEGLGNDRNYCFIGHVQYSCFNLVWGERMRNKLVDFEAPKDRIIPVGNTHLANEKNRLEKNDVRTQIKKKYNMGNKKVVLLVFSAQPPNVSELAPLFEQDKNTIFFVKFHPVTTGAIIDKWKNTVPGRIKEACVMIHGEETVYSLMAAGDLVIMTEPSTTGLEAVAFEKPLVQLKLSQPDPYPFSFVDDGVALHLTPAELSAKLKENSNFDHFIDPEKTRLFLDKELVEPAKSIDKIVDFFNQAVVANQYDSAEQFTYSRQADIDWSIILPVGKNPNTFLAVLEAISNHSENAGGFEVILLEPENTSHDIIPILDSLEGDVERVRVQKDDNLSVAFNTGAAISRGRRLIFLDENIAPFENWLSKLHGELDKNHSEKINSEKINGEKIIGGRIVSRHKNIVHAGMVLDSNNSPVSAYQHLDEKFPPALKKRTFQMVNHFISISRKFFLDLGGFHPKSGSYAFLDLCLHANRTMKDHQAIVLYLPDIKLIKLELADPPVVTNEAIYFYTRWHGDLWESEDQLYAHDGISKLQLDAARVTRAMETANVR